MKFKLDIFEGNPTNACDLQYISPLFIIEFQKFLQGLRERDFFATELNFLDLYNEDKIKGCFNFNIPFEKQIKRTRTIDK